MPVVELVGVTKAYENKVAVSNLEKPAPFA